MKTKIRQLAAAIALLSLVASPLAVQAQEAPATDTPAPAPVEEKKETPAGGEAKKEDSKKEEQKEEKRDGEKKEEAKPDAVNE